MKKKLTKKQQIERQERQEKAEKEFIKGGLIFLGVMAIPKLLGGSE